MQKVKGLFLFYGRSVIPALLISIAISFVGMKFTESLEFTLLGKSYFFISLLWLFFLYQIKYPEEYYFYYNLSLNKATLWGFSFFMSIIISGSICLL